MTLENILLLLIVGGVIGGIAHILAQFRIENSTLRVNGQTTSFIITIILIVFSGFVGIAGAVAIQFILIMLGAFRTIATLTDEMFALSISVAAGFGAKSPDKALEGPVAREPLSPAAGDEGHGKEHQKEKLKPHQDGQEVNDVHRMFALVGKDLGRQPPPEKDAGHHERCPDPRQGRGELPSGG